jgi:hypothetical protein
LGALPQAGPQSITKAIGQQLGLAIHDNDGPFRAGGDAQAAAIALFLINPNNLATFHKFISLS